MQQQEMMNGNLFQFDEYQQQQQNVAIDTTAVGGKTETPPVNAGTSESLV